MGAKRWESIVSNFQNEIHYRIGMPGNIFERGICGKKRRRKKKIDSTKNSYVNSAMFSVYTKSPRNFFLVFFRLIPSHSSAIIHPCRWGFASMASHSSAPADHLLFPLIVPIAPAKKKNPTMEFFPTLFRARSPRKLGHSNGKFFLRICQYDC